MNSSASAASVNVPVPAEVPAVPVPVPVPVAGTRETRKAAASLTVFRNTIERLEQTIEDETAALRVNKALDLRAFNDRKNHGLLELSRTLRVLIGSPYEGEVKAKLVELRGRLDGNLAALKTHLEAVQAVSSIIARAIQEEDSDGTYSGRPASGGPG